MHRRFLTGLRVLGCGMAAVCVLWYTSAICRVLHANAETAAMILLLEVFAIATLGDSILTLVCSIAASLTFSFDYIESTGSFRITTLESAITFSAMVLTALTASHLAIRAGRRTREAIARREEMERINQFGGVLIAANSVAEAAQNAVSNVVELFGLRGAALRIRGAPDVFQSGMINADRPCSIPLDAESRFGVLELYGDRLSDEVSHTLASMICLALDRAKSSEQWAEIEATRRGEELKSTILDALAHNFKTPLTSIKAAASTLRGFDSGFKADARELIAVIDEEADRLNQLICESLDLAKLEGRRADPYAGECMIPRVIEQVITRLACYSGSRECITEIPEDFPVFVGDSFLVEQMLLQVVDNAWKYSRPGTPIRISAALEDGKILLTVRNEGREIPENERDRIFEKFYRGRGVRSTVEGTGLGLAISKKIAEIYNGRVWLDLEPEGPAFHFSLPLNSHTEAI